MTIEQKLERLKKRLGEVCDIRAATALLEWDQETYMPPNGATARGLQIATLSALSHRLFVDREVERLLHDLSAASLPGEDALLVRETLHDYEVATKLPEAFVETFAQEQSRAFHAWVKARQESDFDAFAPHLDRLATLSREKADRLGYEGSPYNALLDLFERGMRAETLTAVFADLAQHQSGLVRRIVESPNQPDRAWLDQTWDEQRQWDFSLRLLRDMGFDFDSGRQDRSVHPFTSNFDLCDVRVTTRISPRDLFSGLLSTLHEGGHALYEQGMPERHRRTPLAECPSLGMHESQSRLWENMVGRSLPYWNHYLEPIREAFPGQLNTVSAEQLHAAINHVEPSLIRVEADECTYNLHIIMRFEIEVALLENRIAVRDIPALWNEKMRQYLGITPPDDARGCLQDVHWSHGLFGYFPTYALGNLYSAMWLEVVERTRPALWDEIAAGEFAPLRAWLRENIHQHGRCKQAADFARDIAGGELDAAPYRRYLDAKYGALYGLTT